MDNIYFLEAIAEESGMTETEFVTGFPPDKENPKTTRQESLVKVTANKNQLIIESSRDHPITELQVAKVKKIINNAKPKSVAEELDKQKEIEAFLYKFNSRDFSGVSVKEMRHIIPLFLMEVYAEIYGHYSRKVKGLWEKNPLDWPSSVPFVDPNNKVRNEGNCKPKKEVLVKMLKYLVQRFDEKNSADKEILLEHSSDPALFSLINLDFVQSDDQDVVNLVETIGPEFQSVEQTIMPSCSSGEQLFSSYSGIDDKSVAHSGSLGSLEAFQASQASNNYSTGEEFSSDGPGVMQEDDTVCNESFSKMVILDRATESNFVANTKDRPHGQVDDHEDNRDWNPVQDVMERIRKKVIFMSKENIIRTDDLNQLKKTHERLIYSSSNKDDLLLLKRAHLLDRCIDLVKFHRRLPAESLEMLKNLQEELNVKSVEMERVTDGVTELNNASAVREVPLDSLNIKPRSMPEGLQSFPTGSTLELRCLSQGHVASSTSWCGKQSLLSDKCKPIQAVDDGQPQKSTESPFPEDNFNSTDEMSISHTEAMPILPLDDLDFLELPGGYDQFFSTTANETKLSVQETGSDVQVCSQSSENLGPFVVLQCKEDTQPLKSGNTFFTVQDLLNLQMSPSTEFVNSIESLSLSSDTGNSQQQQQPILKRLFNAPNKPYPTGGKRKPVFQNEDRPAKILRMEELQRQSGGKEDTQAIKPLIPVMVEEMSALFDQPPSRPSKKKSFTSR